MRRALFASWTSMPAQQPSCDDSASALLCCLLSGCLLPLLQYAQFSGIVGVVVYALASGIPILFVGFFGSLVTRDMPHVFSISDFVGWRFGPIAKLMVFLICVFNMSIALLAEYTTIGAIFSDFVGSVSYGIIIIIGVLTLLYTAYGGERYMLQSMLQYMPQRRLQCSLRMCAACECVQPGCCRFWAACQLATFARCKEHSDHLGHTTALELRAVLLLP